MQSQVIEMISAVKEDPELVAKLNGHSDIIHDAGLDSLQLVHFMLQVEDAFDVEIDFDSFELEHLRSVNAFCSYIQGISDAEQVSHPEGMETV
ncbi:D-alanyl carrier protein [Paenibacillus polymyxa]|uniref:acyl carrier protein n=1 Tax=Paenibacillus polymyxa TaxID=1406 RepID=UPI0010BE50AC|nr:phosphopantetheine-binding protein [Paenibacillus polymyxa]TKH34452.1 D-alanyl carrier protein [Paenibacillus polymyxa]